MGFQSFASSFFRWRSLVDPFAPNSHVTTLPWKVLFPVESDFWPPFKTASQTKQWITQMLTILPTVCYNRFHRFRLPHSGAECWGGDFRLHLIVKGSAILFGFTKILSLISLIKGPQKPNLRMERPITSKTCISAASEPFHTKVGQEHRRHTRISMMYFVLRRDENSWIRWIGSSLSPTFRR